MAGCSNFGFTLPVTGDRGKFLSSTSDRHAIFEALAPSITTTGIPASFEQTKRVPTGHPDVCLCDVSGATNDYSVVFIRHNSAEIWVFGYIITLALVL